MLVAVDLWVSYWILKRVILKVEGDNVSALVLLIKMRPKTGVDGSPKLAVIARELALLRSTFLSRRMRSIHRVLVTNSQTCSRR